MLLAVLVGGLVLVVVLAIRGGDDDEPGGPTTTSTTTKPVSKTGQELLDLLAKGRDLPLHIKFDPDPTQVSETSGSLTMELWRRDGQVRQDLVLAGTNVRSEVSAFELPDGNAVCQRASEAEWVCNATKSTATENGEPAGIIESAAKDLAGAKVAATEDTILGTPVRCYAIDGESGRSTLCVTDEGVPMRIAVSNQVLTASVVEREVDPKVFQLPAKLTSPGTSQG